MGTGWLTCIPAVLLPHSPCRFTTANAPANRQMPIASVVSGQAKKKKNIDMEGQIRSKYNFFIIGLLLTVIVGIFGLFGTLSIFKVIEDLEYGVPFTKTLFIVPLIFFPFIFYTVYYLLTSFPVVTIDSIGIKLTTVFNSKSYYWSDIEEIELTGKQPHKFLFISMPTEATTIKFKDGIVFYLWVDYYRNKSELRVILDRANKLLKQKTKTMISLDFDIERKKITETDIQEIDGEEFNGNHILTFNGLLLYGWLAFIAFFAVKLTDVSFDSFIPIIVLTFVALTVPAISIFQMNYFVISDELLVVKNTIWFWRKEIYYLKDISEVVIETPHKRETSLRVITTDFRDKLYSAGSLRKKTWKRLIERFETAKIKVRNEEIFF